MRRALEHMRADYRVLRSPTLAEVLSATTVTCVQWSGPWNAVPRAAAAHRHFIATAAGLVYDVNVGWLDASTWATDVAPELVPRRGDGSWLYTWAAAIR